MSDRDEPDDESSDDLWDEVGEFDGVDSSDIEELTTAGPNGVDDVDDLAEPDRSEPVGEADPIDDPPAGEAFDDSDGIGSGHDGMVDDSDGMVDDGLPNTDDAPEADEVFDEMDMSAVDGEALWNELAGAETEAGSFGGDDATSVDAGVDEPIDAAAVEPSVDESADRSTGDSDRDGAGGTETLIDKRAYCQQCPYFSAPPEVSCHHDGTEIIEVITDGRFRVRDCPVVTDTGPDRTILNDGH